MTMTVFAIRDVYGEVIAEHVKVALPGGKKRMYWRIPGMSPEDGLCGLSTPDLPLYGADRAGRLSTGQTVILTEGETACEALWSLGLAAFGTVTGAGSTPGEDALAVLLPFDVVTWEDNDESGEKHMARTAAGLMRLGGTARRLIWAGAREKGDDAADFVRRGGTSRTVELMIVAAERWRIEPRQLARAVRPLYRESDRSRYRTEAARAHLLDVVEARLGPPVKKAGRSVLWRCPFHAGDNDPSFKVDLREPFYRCFGCSARGDVFTFLRAMEGVEFKDALSSLAPTPALGGIPSFGA